MNQRFDPEYWYFGTKRGDEGYDAACEHVAAVGCEIDLYCTDLMNLVRGTQPERLAEFRQVTDVTYAGESL